MEAIERGATIGAMQNPASIRWTDHAAVKAVHLGITRSDVESAVLDHHHRRQRNHRGGEWKLVASGLVVVYNHPTRMIRRSRWSSPSGASGSL